MHSLYLGSVALAQCLLVLAQTVPVLYIGNVCTI